MGQTVLALFYKCVSKHAKHVFFIASLHGQYSHYAQHRRMAVEKLNEVIDLAFRPEALHFPIALHAKVWKDTGVDQILTETAIVNAVTEAEVRTLATKVVQISPRWSRYGTEEEMIKDTAAWIRSQHQHYLEAA
jgi:hypothetical protein